MSFDLSAIDYWYILPLWAKVLPFTYFICVFYLQFSMQLLTTVFAGAASRATSDTKVSFWLLTILFWTACIAIVALVVNDRINAVIDDCCEEFVIQYFKIRPLATVNIHERRRRWEQLAEEMNNYIQTQVHTFDRSLMKRFHLTDEGVEELVETYIWQFDRGNWRFLFSQEVTTFEMLSPEMKLLSKLKQTHNTDGANAYKDILNNPDVLFNGSQSGSSSSKGAV